MKHEDECACSKCELGDAWMEHTRQKIEKFGIAVVGVFDNEPTFCYSIGAKNLGLPELLMVGMPGMRGLQMMHHFINTVYLKWKEDGHATFGETNEFTESYEGKSMPLGIKLVDAELAERDFLCQVKQINGDEPFEVAQIFWSDTNGILPYKEGCLEAYKQNQLVVPIL